jgi:hypothetical protein
VTIGGKTVGELAKHLLTGGSVGLGAAFGYFLMSANGDERRLLIETVAKFGPWFVMGIAGMVFMNQRVSEGISVLKENAASQQKLADAVNTIAQRDDNRQREQELTMATLVRQQEELHGKIDGIAETLNSRAMSAGA